MKLVLILAFTSAQLFASLNYENLQAYLEQKDIRSIESLLQNMKSSNDDYMKSFLSNYVLMYGSRSLQDSSFSNPRVITYSDNFDFVFSFNGDPNHRGFNSLEVMQFDNSQRKFEMFSVTFDGENKPVFSEKNPPLCLSCHTNDPRPNWEAYPFWPGAYGSEDDRTFMSYSLEHLDSYKSLSEFIEYSAFESNSNSHDRYKHLVPISKEVNESMRLKTRPNLSFTIQVNKNNMKRVSRKLRQQENSIAFKYAILGATFCSPRVEDFIPAGLPIDNFGFDQFYSNEISLFINGQQESIDHHNTVFRDNLLDDLTNFSNDRERYSNSTFITSDFTVPYIGKLMGMNIRDWGTNFNTNILNFGTLQNFILEEFVLNIINDFFEGEERDLILSKLASTNYDERYAPAQENMHRIEYRLNDYQSTCDEWSTKSKELLRNHFSIEETNTVEVVHQRTEERSTIDMTLTTCNSCHAQENSDFVPHIPFTDEQALKEKLDQRPELIDLVHMRTNPDLDPTMRMPRGREALKSHERTELIEYLRSL